MSQLYNLLEVWNIVDALCFENFQQFSCCYSFYFDFGQHITNTITPQVNIFGFLKNVLCNFWFVVILYKNNLIHFKRHILVMLNCQIQTHYTIPSGFNMNYKKVISVWMLYMSTYLLWNLTIWKYWK